MVMAYSEEPSAYVRLKKLRAKAQKANAVATPLQLPKEIWGSIFALLPLKMLGMCRRVCKTWNSILTDAAFISIHLDRAKASSSSCSLRCKFMVSGNGSVYTMWRTSTLPEEEKEDDDVSNKFRRVPPGFPLSRKHSGILGVNPIGISGGIYCLQVMESNYDNLMIWNPSIRKCMLLQRRPRSRLINPYVGSRLVLQGFGFDPVSNDYKFVMVCRRPQQIVTQVYSLARGTWSSKPFALALPLQQIFGYSFGVCEKGVLYWAIQEQQQQQLKSQGFRGYLNEDWRNNLILNFDIKDEVFGVSENTSKKHFQDLQDKKGIFNPIFDDSFFECLVLGDKQAKPMPWSKGVLIIDAQVLRLGKS